jgi:hypothetical protein
MRQCAGAPGALRTINPIERMSYAAASRSAKRMTRSFLANATMISTHKNKTLASLLAAALGGFGCHRFYIYGKKDRWAWIYPAALLLFIGAGLLAGLPADLPPSFFISVLALFPLSIYAGFIEALMIGLTPDDKWDAKHNPGSDRRSASGWPLIVLLVLTLGGGFIAVILSMARATDLFHTGGSFG